MAEKRQTFRLPCASQDASPLFQLAVEIRVKIFRNLHKSDSVIEPLFSEDFPEAACEVSDRNEYREINSFSGQILATCQRLNLESGFTLYAENTMAISLGQGYCDILDKELDMPAALEELTVEHVDLFSMTRRDETRYPRRQRAIWNQRLQEVCNLTSRFTRLRVIIKTKCDEDMYCISRAVRDLIRNKDVTICLEDKEFLPGPLRDHKGLMLSLRGLRCSSVQFESAVDILQDHIQALTKVVTSSDDVHDLLPVWLQVKDLVYRDFYGIDVWRHRRDSLDAFRWKHRHNIKQRLAIALLHYDTKRFWELLDDILSQAEDYNEECLKEASYDTGLECVDALEELLEEVPEGQEELDESWEKAWKLELRFFQGLLEQLEKIHDNCEQGIEDIRKMNPLRKTVSQASGEASDAEGLYLPWRSGLTTSLRATLSTSQ